MLSIYYGPCHPCHLWKHQLCCYLDWLHLCFLLISGLGLEQSKCKLGSQLSFTNVLCLKLPLVLSAVPAHLAGFVERSGKIRDEMEWVWVVLLSSFIQNLQGKEELPLCNAVQYALGQNRFGCAGGPAVSILSHRDLLGQHRRWTLLVFLTFWDHGERKKENYLFFFFYASNTLM